MWSFIYLFLLVLFSYFIKLGHLLQKIIQWFSTGTASDLTVWNNSIDILTSVKVHIPCNFKYNSISEYVSPLSIDLNLSKWIYNADSVQESNITKPSRQKQDVLGTTQRRSQVPQQGPLGKSKYKSSYSGEHFSSG